MLWTHVASHFWWLEGRVLARTIFGDVFCVDASDTVGRYIYYFGVWEPNLTAWLRRTLQPGDGFVDVGANVGYFTVLASRLVGPAGGVVAIEALPAIHKTLEENTARNDAGNVRTVCLAAWDVDTSLEMFTRSRGPSGTSTTSASWADRWELDVAITVDARPLQDVLRAHEVARARVIKIDAEGAEWRVIKGLADLLPRFREEIEIVVEMAPDLLREDGACAEDLAGLLASHGLRPYRIENDYSATSYVRPDSVSRPVQIEEFPQHAEQFDVIFSRTNARVL